MSNTTSSSAVSPFSAGSLGAARAGAGGGLLSFLVGEIVGHFTDSTGGAPATDLISLLVGSALWSGAVGLTIGAAILIYDNLRSLRGQWHRDLLGALPLFFALSFLGGVAGQASYLVIQNSITRGIGWALMGAAIGVGLGAIRRDMLQAARGALGGALGGFIGGFIFDALTGVSNAGGGSLSRLVGQIIMGALIALLMRVVQDAMKSAWLLGISSGPYEGKEYPLNTASVSVGRDDSNAIALFREPKLAPRMGALMFQNNGWFWRGEAIGINGIPQENAPVNPGDTLQIGATKFRFQSRSAKTNSPIYQPPSAPAPNGYAPPPNSYTPPPAITPPAITPPAITPPAITPPAITPPAITPTVADWPNSVASANAPANAPTIRATMPTFVLTSLNGPNLKVPDGEAAQSIGRASANAIVLGDAGVSSRHAQLQWTGGALVLTDLGSTNGSFVNGDKLSPHSPRRLKTGDRLRFGKLDYTLRSL